MIKLINTCGTVTWVHESRLGEYLRRGYRQVETTVDDHAPAGCGDSQDEADSSTEESASYLADDVSAATDEALDPAIDEEAAAYAADVSQKFRRTKARKN